MQTESRMSLNYKSSTLHYRVNYLKYNHVELPQSAWCSIPFTESESRGNSIVMRLWKLKPICAKKWFFKKIIFSDNDTSRHQAITSRQEIIKSKLKVVFSQHKMLKFRYFIHDACCNYGVFCDSYSPGYHSVFEVSISTLDKV